MVFELHLLRMNEAIIQVIEMQVVTTQLPQDYRAWQMLYKTVRVLDGLCRAYRDVFTACLVKHLPGPAE